jgi:hypothetical protein
VQWSPTLPDAVEFFSELILQFRSFAVLAAQEIFLVLIARFRKTGDLSFKVVLSVRSRGLLAPIQLPEQVVVH